MNHIMDEPAFAWWVSKLLRRHNIITPKVKSKYWRTTHNLGIRLPNTVEDSLRIDKVAGNDYWKKDLNNEMNPGRGCGV